MIIRDKTGDILTMSIVELTQIIESIDNNEYFSIHDVDETINKVNKSNEKNE